ncbi:nucleotide-diphospho-sugar transferase [Hymenobacter algoricola]|uniref:Hemolytic protein HlpA n=1 Tax=Hymenobacter algoricola TaxID=486267 RepID=A0ABP7MRG6_9BACT
MLPLPPPPTPDTELSAPVLLLLFNRPTPARRVFEAVRQARPARLYVAVDGPRADRPAEAALCAATRAVVTSGVDWPCEVQTLFREANLGCSRGVAGAIRWFFDHEPEGIILEDDCLPTPGFFRFCQELLARYRHDTRVMHIGGNNLSPDAQHPAAAAGEAYHFSGQVHSWGWATWRRAWQHYDFHYAQLPELRRRGALPGMYPSLLERHYWLRKFEAMRTGPQPPHTWDYQWHFSVAANSGLAIVPAVNLVTNIGFGDDATHTFDPLDRLAHLRTAELQWPLQHPPGVLRDWIRDQRHFRQHLTERAGFKIRQLLRRLLPVRSGALAPSLPAPALPPTPNTFATSISS